jgi:hypothetical protein
MEPTPSYLRQLDLMGHGIMGNLCVQLVTRFVMSLCQIDVQSILQYSSINTMPKVHELAKESPPT